MSVTKPSPAEQLLTWLKETQSIIKAQGLATEAQIDGGIISRWITGKLKRQPNKKTLTKLAAVATRYGFTTTTSTPQP